MFTIPNEDDATYEAQARVSSVDLQALATGFARTGVVSGMAVSVSTGRDLDISSGAYEINGSPISSVAKTGTIGVGDATHPRIDIVSVDGDGSVHIATGTPATDPVAPNVVLDRVVLASIYVPAGMATLLPDMISDRRVLLTSAGLNAESIQDIVAAFAAAGTGIDITYDDVLGTLTFSVNALSITDTFPVNSQAAMLSLTAQRGDVAVRSDLPGTFILATDDPTQLANWVLLPTPTDSVLSVNGLTGAVTITLANLNGVPTSRTVAGLDLSSNITATNLLAALSAQSGADFALNGHKLIGVADGTNPQDAVTKAQADAITAAVAALAASVSLSTQWFGDGSDGNVTISGATNLTGPTFYNNLVVNGRLNTNNHPFYVKGTLSGNGRIAADGGDAGTSASTAPAIAAGSLGGGGNFGTNGVTGNATQTSALANRVGGTGGAGGNGSSGSGGAAQTGTAPTAARGGPSSWVNPAVLVSGQLPGSGSILAFGGGIGGSGGGGDSTNTGGGGGSGAGLMYVAARTITFTGLFSAIGGAGATRTTGNVGGGGGGGGGAGVVITATKAAAIGFTTSAAGGAGGAGVGTGTAGSQGGAGSIVVYTGG